MTYITVINLIVAPVILTLIYVYALAKIIRKEKAIARRSTVGLIITSFYIASLLIIFTVPQLNAKDILQLLLTVGLVVATVSYAISATKQADASLKMAKEMREQRYDALRPIIDIVNMQQMPIELARQAYAKEPPKELTCKLCNVGVGPATDVYSFVYHDSGERRRRNLDTIVIGKEIGPERLSVAQKDDHWFLVVYYKDVYGRWFESSREVRLGAVNPDPLQIREITEEELP